MDIYDFDTCSDYNTSNTHCSLFFITVLISVYSTCFIINLCLFCYYLVDGHLLMSIHSTLLFLFPFSRWIHLLHINISAVKISPIFFWGNIEYPSNDFIYFVFFPYPSILFSFRYQYIIHSLMVITSISTAVDFI